MRGLAAVTTSESGDRIFVVRGGNHQAADGAVTFVITAFSGRRGDRDVLGKLAVVAHPLEAEQVPA